jgi:hypothetical protein
MSSQYKGHTPNLGKVRIKKERERSNMEIAEKSAGAHRPRKTTHKETWDTR